MISKFLRHKKSNTDIISRAQFFSIFIHSVYDTDVSMCLCKRRTALGLGSWWPWKWALPLQMKSHDVSCKGE